MKNTLLISAALAIGLAACGQPQTDKVEEQTGAAAGPAQTDTAEMPMAADTARTGKGTGTITAVDPAAGKITIDHAPIPDVEWPAMTMAFTATPAVVETARVGDQVDFDLTVRGNASEVTAIRPK